MTDAKEEIGELVGETVTPNYNTTLKQYRAETERLKVLIDFLQKPLCAKGGPDADEDILIAYNLAVETALYGVRKAAMRANSDPSKIRV